MTIAELFSAGSTDWLRVNPKLRTYWHTLIAVTTVPLLTAAAIAIAIFEDVPMVRFIGVVSIMVIMIFAIWAWVLVTRRVRSIGYRLESRELKVSSGIMFRRVVSVPFARMQLVEVSAGPLERAFSLASVQLHTASASTDATIPGLDPERAAEIRDALAVHSATSAAATTAGL
jgi:membrane protein YdbS with pleckstrin-like domain